MRKNVPALIIVLFFGIFLWKGTQINGSTQNSFSDKKSEKATSKIETPENLDDFSDLFFGEEPEVLGEETSESLGDDQSDISISNIGNLEKIELKYVIDGDTIKLSDDRYLRLVGIDAPEKDTYFFEQSGAKLEELLSSKVIYAEKDISETDRYGRLLRYLWVDGKLINLEMVRLGYAYIFTYPPDVKYSTNILAAQKEAQKNHQGFWQ